jgi:hypothetical protein
LVLVIVTAILEKIMLDAGTATLARVVVHLSANILLALLFNALTQYRFRQKPFRKPVGEPRPVARPPAPPAVEPSVSETA